MGKVKAIVKPTKPKLSNKIVKKKKANVASKFKKVGITNLVKKHESESDNSDSEAAVGKFILAPSVNESYSEKDLGGSELKPHVEGKFVSAPNIVDNAQVKNGVLAFIKYLNKTQKDEVKLFDADSSPVFLHISSVKVARTPNRQAHLSLKHSLLEPDSEICLIVKDGDNKKEFEDTVEQYQNLLQSHGITNVKEIMTYYQLKTEYGIQYEMKRKLLGLYDYFLVDGCIFGYVTHILGKIFYEKCKMPRPVNLKATKLKEHFENILSKTSMKIHSKSDSFSVQVGRTNLDVKKMYENVIEVIEDLNNEFPGGLDNIRSIGIKTDKSITVPLYLSLKHKRSQKVPVVKAKRSKNFVNVSGELSTFNNRTVTVLPSGEVIVKDENPNKKSKVADSDFYESQEFDDMVKDFEDTLRESDEEVDEKPILKKGKKVKKGRESTTNLLEKEEDNEENETILEQAEDMYLNEYQHEQTLKRKRKVSDDGKVKITKSGNDNDKKRNKKAGKKAKNSSNEKLVEKSLDTIKKKKQKPSGKKAVEIKIKSQDKKTSSDENVTRINKKANKKLSKEVVNGIASKKLKGASKTQADRKKQNKKIKN